MKKTRSHKISKTAAASIFILVAAAIVFFSLLFYLHAGKGKASAGEDYVEYEKAVVTAILTDTSAPDEAADGAYRGEQMLTARVESGQYKGEELLVYNYVGPLYSVPVKEGDSVVLSISTYASGDHNATVYEFNRLPVIVFLILLFFAVVSLIGRKTGIKSLVGLVFTILCLFLILIPLLLRGAPTIPVTFLICAFIALVCFTILGGICRKTISALLGTLAGTALAALFALLAQALSRVNGLRLSDVEPLLQLRQDGSGIGLAGLLVAGIIVSSLGAVMDVAISISSSLEEVHQANPSLSPRQLFTSGMNIGRDLVGTMTNTLILAFLGSGFTLIIYLHSLGLSFYQLFSSAYLSIEVISGISCSIGMILAIPLTALISTLLVSRHPS